MKGVRKMAVKLIDELQKEIKAAGEAVKQEAYEKHMIMYFRSSIIWKSC